MALALLILGPPMALGLIAVLAVIGAGHRPATPAKPTTREDFR